MAKREKTALRESNGEGLDFCFRHAVEAVSKIKFSVESQFDGGVAFKHTDLKGIDTGGNFAQIYNDLFRGGGFRFPCSVVGGFGIENVTAIFAPESEL